MQDWLSSKIMGGFKSMTLKSARRFFIHIKSVEAVANAIYSTSVDDRATAVCLLLVHDTTFPSVLMRKPEVDLRSSSLP